MSLVQIQMFASDHIINDTFVVQLETKLENSILAILSQGMEVLVNCSFLHMRQPTQKAGWRRSEQEQKEAPLSLVTAGQVINGPFESVPAARREVHSHTKISVSRHLDSLLCLGLWVCMIL